MKKEIKAELVAQAVIGYILLLLIVLAIYLIFALLVDLNIFSKQADQSTILTNLFIWSATLYTPFLAYMAYSDWKEQKHYDVVINTLNEMVDTVNNLSTEIDSFRGKSIYEPNNNANGSVPPPPEYPTGKQGQAKAQPAQQAEPEVQEDLPF